LPIKVADKGRVSPPIGAADEGKVSSPLRFVDYEQGFSASVILPLA
jgi:hypothetical protein